MSAFFWTYTPGQMLAGWLAERINAYRTLAIGLAIWALATAATGLAGGFMAMIALRLVLGVGESAAFPCSSKLLAQHLPAHRLGFANGLIALGFALGPAFGTFAGGLLMARFGWRATFLVFGLASLAWLGPWLMTTRHASARADSRRRSTRAVRSGHPAASGSLGRRPRPLLRQLRLLFRDLLAAALPGQGARLLGVARWLRSAA